MASETIVVAFDCGRFGKVIWHVPRGLFSGASDANIRARVVANVGPIVGKVFALFSLMIGCAKPALVREATSRLDQHLFNSRARIERQTGLR